MTTSLDPQAEAFRDLQRRLARRRIAALEPALRIELVILAALIGGFLFIEVRGPFEVVSERSGVAALVGIVALLGLGLAAVATRLVVARHRRRLRRPEGPEWLGLPLDSSRLSRHLAAESRSQVGWVVLPAIAALAATIGLVPVAMLLLLAAAFAGLLVGAGRLGCRLALASVARAAAPRPGLSAIECVLAEAGGHRADRPRHPAARWRKLPAWLVLMDKDARAMTRVGALRQAALVVVALGVISLLGWLLPGEPGSASGGTALASTFDYRNMATFFVTLLCAGALADGLVRLVGSDPFAPLRVLPIGMRAVWGARVAWAVMAGMALVAGHGMLAHGLDPGPRWLFIGWVFGVVVGAGVLGVQFAMTLYPRVEAAGRLIALSFALMAITSLVIFLSGWVVLVGLILYTARRLPRWEQATEA